MTDTPPPNISDDTKSTAIALIDRFIHRYLHVGLLTIVGLLIASIWVDSVDSRLIIGWTLVAAGLLAVFDVWYYEDPCPHL